MSMVDAPLNERYGCVNGCRGVWNLRYADDTTLVARSREELMQQQQAIELEKIVYILAGKSIQPRLISSLQKTTINP